MGRRRRNFYRRDDGLPKPFWDRHFAALLTFTGLTVAAVLAISDTAARIFVNQPPGVSLRLNSFEIESGSSFFAYAIANDPDGRAEDLHYRWVLFPPGDQIDEGAGQNKSWVKLLASEPGNYSLLVTVTDDSGQGKADIADIQFRVGPSAHVQTQDSQGEATTRPIHVPRIAAFSERLSLSSDSTIDWSEIRAELIVTNGNRLTLLADSIETDLTILAYDSAASGGQDGQPGNAGASGGLGSAGAPGGSGQDGASGEPGSPADSITVRISGELSAKLTINNSGQPGGRGGNGGQGGPGGSGGRGKPSQTGVLDCRSGPGWGGPGGDGGDGGNGGDSGAGGDAGSVVVTAGSISTEGRVRVTALGGSSAEPGRGGSGGLPGAGGPEGDARGLCRPAGRRGPSGSLGSNGAPGSRTGSGASKRVTLDLGSLQVAEAIGEIAYPANSDQ